MCIVGLMAACEIINPEESIPAYIHIEPFEVTTALTQGSTSSKITEAWLTVDGDFLGAYSLPADIPVLKEGEVELRIEAGIKDNGITATPEIYPFYMPYITQATLKPAESIDILPRAVYRNGIDFAMLEDFEQPPYFFTQDIDGNLNTRVTPSSEDVFEGSRSGKITLTPENNIIEVATDFARPFKEVNKDGIYVYLELNYKTDTQIAFGLIGNHSGNQLPEVFYQPILFPKEEWNKIYLNLSEVVFSLDAETYQVAILAQLPAEMEEAHIWLDNVKLIHF